MRLLPPMFTIGKSFDASLLNFAPKPWSLPHSKLYVTDWPNACVPARPAASAIAASAFLTFIEPLRKGYPSFDGRLPKGHCLSRVVAGGTRLFRDESPHGSRI